MSLVQPTVAERRSNPPQNITLSSNNPFRNRAASPAMPSPSSTTSATGARPVSRNPFLTASEVDNNATGPAHNASLLDGAIAAGQKQGGPPSYTGATEELFDLTMEAKFRRFVEMFANYPKTQKNLTFDENKTSDDTGLLPPFRSTERSSREVNLQDASLRNGQNGAAKVRAPAPHSEQRKSENRRPRRNSESSAMDKRLSSDEERKRRERHQREREARHKDGKPRSSRPRKPHGLDLIDKLDVTGIYGPGLFHHDGPFDACNPHRNHKRDNRAPMQAFPANSANNALGGSGPVNKSIDYNQFHGRGAEGFTDYGSGYDRHDSFSKLRPSAARTMSFDPKDRIEVHGEESVGLGTSTFLEGAPASRTAIQRRESESENTGGGGLGRKKSLAQRFRGLSQPRRPVVEGGRIMSPDARYELRSPTSPERTPLAAQGPQSAGGRLRMYEKNPFFGGDEDAGDKKGASVKIAEAENKVDRDSIGRDRALSSPRKTLERQATSESIEPDPKPVSGFLSRVKSLKGGKRTRPERPGS